MTTIFLAKQKFFENWHGYSAGNNLWFKNFVEIALSSTVFEIQAFLCFAIFAKNSKIGNCCHFLARQNFFKNWHNDSAEIPCGSKILSKSLYLAWFSRYKHFCVLQFLRKTQNGRHVWRDKYFLKIGTTLQRYPVGQKFR